MEKDNAIKVKVLRERLCIGFQDGIDLLKQTKGDVEKASAIFKEKMLNLTLSVIKLPPEEVIPYLEKYKYDAGKVIDTMLDEYRLVDGLPQPLPVYILHKFRNDKKEAIRRIAGLIIDKKKLQGKFPRQSYEYPWLSSEDMLPLNRFSLCVVALSEWLEYEDDEPFESALFYNLDLVASQIQVLQMPELAAALRMARDIYKELFDQYQSLSEALYKALQKDQDFRAAQKYFLESRALLVENLYTFISDHLDKLEI